MKIKFRAWDKQQKRWTNYAITDDLQRFYDKHTGCWKTDKTQERFKLMQSTGLKDKNGVEIFEGDIVLIRGDKVDLGNSKAIVKNDNYELYVEYANGKYLNDSLSSICLPMEVISNIYENKELL